MNMLSKQQHTLVESSTLSANDNTDPFASLHASMEALYENAGKQIESAREYKASASNLKDSIDRLEQSWVRYDRKIRRIDMEPLRQKALRLSEIMDDSLA